MRRPVLSSASSQIFLVLAIFAGIWSYSNWDTTSVPIKIGVWFVVAVAGVAISIVFKAVKRAIDRLPPSDESHDD